MERERLEHLAQSFPSATIEADDGRIIVMTSSSREVPAVCEWLCRHAPFHAAGIVAEDEDSSWLLRYLLYDVEGHDVVQVCGRNDRTVTAFHSASPLVHAFDWHEREVEDVFELTFEGHPRLGDFVLHDDHWNEGVAPMRKRFDGAAALEELTEARDWKPRRVVEAPGAFIMSVGPVFSGMASPVNYLLESAGEEVIRAYPRLFFAYRGIEKVFEGLTYEDGLLVAERFSQTTAIAHGIAYCRAIEEILGITVPPRAEMIRGFLAELERIRHHAGILTEIIESTALAIPASEAAMCEEQLLRLTSVLTHHRYGSGILAIGGVSRDISGQERERAADRIASLSGTLRDVASALSHSSSFLDRLEDVGTLSVRDGRTYGLVGPVARASGLPIDLRSGLPYGAYRDIDVPLSLATEGDNYARVRMLFEDIRISSDMCRQFAGTPLDAGPLRSEIPAIPKGWGLGWSEAPQGADFMFLRLGEDSRIERAHIMPPSFANWHGLHKAAEGFAFQDFPIIVATLGLSVAENDR